MQHLKIEAEIQDTFAILLESAKECIFTQHLEVNKEQKTIIINSPDVNVDDFINCIGSEGVRFDKSVCFGRHSLPGKDGNSKHVAKLTVLN